MLYGRELRQPHLVGAEAGQDRAAPPVLRRRQEGELRVEMEQQALGLLAIEFLRGARGALGTPGHGSCDPSYRAAPRGSSTDPAYKGANQRSCL